MVLLIPQRLVLFDGDQLTRLMVLYGVGHRALRARADGERPGAGGIDPFSAKRLSRPRMPIYERKPCSGWGLVRRMSTGMSVPGCTSAVWCWGSPSSKWLS